MSLSLLQGSTKDEACRAVGAGREMGDTLCGQGKLMVVKPEE